MISFCEECYPFDLNFTMGHEKFEHLHPKQLRWNQDDRQDFRRHDGGHGIWMYLDDEMIGEILWNKMDSWRIKKKIAYIWSLSIAKEHQEKGYGQILKLVLYSSLKNIGYTEVRGHARDGKSWKLSKKLGAKLIKTIENYQQTGEKYHYYKQKLI